MNMTSLIALLAVISLAFADEVHVNDIQQLEAVNQSPNPQTVILNDIQVPAGQTLELQGLKPGSTIVFAGHITFGYKEWSRPLVVITGQNLKVEGRPGHLIDGDGQRWWDGKGGNGGRKKPWPTVYFNLESSTVDGLNIKDCPMTCVAINACKNVHFSNINIDVALGHSKGGHNTDGFDVAISSNVRISNSTVNNQDDCINIGSGNDIVFDNNVCIRGHGIAISAGDYEVNEVTNVLIKSCKVIKGTIGIRVKTNKRGTGLVKGVTFDDIELQDITTTGIVIIGNYLNSGPRGEPNPNIPIHDLVINNVRGTVSGKGTNVLVYVAPGTPQGWFWNSNVTGGGRMKGCLGVPSTITDPCV